MALRESLEQSGSWLFRYRSYVPLVLIILLVSEIHSFTYVDNSHEMTELWQWTCLLVSLLGLGVRAMTVGFVPTGTSGRNAREQVADALNTTGMYSVVRHPLYLGNYLIFLGFILFFRSWQLILLSTCLYAIYYERIMLTEESFLRNRFGADFERWADATPAFIPRMSGWVSPNLPFSMRTVLAREYTGLFLITTVFALLDQIGDSVVENRFIIDWRWIAVFSAGTVAYVTLRTLKKHTDCLRVAGR